MKPQVTKKMSLVSLSKSKLEEVAGGEMPRIRVGGYVCGCGFSTGDITQLSYHLSQPHYG